MSLFETRKELDPELENGLKEIQNMDFQKASCGSNPRNIRKTVPNQNKFYNCTLCLLNFSRKSDLKEHILTDHAGIKPHKCLLCESSFAHKSQLKLHIASVHEGLKPHKCPSCEKSFLYKSPG